MSNVEVHHEFDGVCPLCEQTRLRLELLELLHKERADDQARGRLKEQAP